MNNNFDKEHFSCRCENNHHQFIVRSWTWDDGKIDFSICIMLDHYLNFFQRIWVALLYVFKIDSGDQFSDVLLTKEDRARLIKILKVDEQQDYWSMDYISKLGL